MQLEFGGRRVTVTAADLVIGSDPGATLQVEGLGVLPRHAVVRARADGRVEVTPAVPGALLLRNGVRIGASPQSLVAGDRIVLGDQEILILDAATPAGAAQRLHNTMMGMPVIPPGARPSVSQPGPSPAPVPPAPSGRLPLLLVAALVLVVAGYVLLVRG